MDRAEDRTTEKVIAVARKLSGFHIAAPDLPWRRYRTPYRVFLAEFLLVRTRSDVVAALFEDIVTRFPDLESLASADEREIGTVLEPLGLRKRVPYLKKAAKYLLEHHGGRIPKTVEELKKVPGLGDYTAAAVAAFAYNAATIPADVNILRFLSRLTGLPMEHATKGSAKLRSLLPLLSPSRGGPRPETLLDFCRLICRPRRPRCDECPLTRECEYAHRSAVP